jgi:membrane glycosyltransferase
MVDVRQKVLAHRDPVGVRRFHIPEGYRTLQVLSKRRLVLRSERASNLVPRAPNRVCDPLVALRKARIATWRDRPQHDVAPDANSDEPRNAERDALSDHRNRPIREVPEEDGSRQ